MKRLFSIVFLSVILAEYAIGGVAIAISEQWLCVADAMTGFRYSDNTQRWELKQFFLRNEKYIISELKDPVVLESTAMRYSVRKFDDETNFLLCKAFDEGGQLDCGLWTKELNFNRNTGRYVLLRKSYYISVGEYDSKYIPKSDDETGDLTIQIGRCSSF